MVKSWTWWSLWASSNSEYSVLGLSFFLCSDNTSDIPLTITLHNRVIFPPLLIILFYSVSKVWLKGIRWHFCGLSCHKNRGHNEVEIKPLQRHFCAALLVVLIYALYVRKKEKLQLNQKNNSYWTLVLSLCKQHSTIVKILLVSNCLAAWSCFISPQTFIWIFKGLFFMD